MLEWYNVREDNPLPSKSLLISVGIVPIPSFHLQTLLFLDLPQFLLLDLAWQPATNRHSIKAPACSCWSLLTSVHGSRFAQNREERYDRGELPLCFGLSVRWFEFHSQNYRCRQDNTISLKKNTHTFKMSTRFVDDNTSIEKLLI